MREYNFLKNQSINKFYVSELHKEPYLIENDVMNYVGFDTKAGFTMRDYPCRTHFQKNHDISKVELEKNFSKYYLENDTKVDFSTFIPIPNYVKCYAMTYIKGEKGVNRFEIKTCGGVKIWLNGENVHTFSHYHRNDVKIFSFELDLTGDFDELLIMFDDLVERDAEYYIELITLQNIATALPVKDLTHEEFDHINGLVNELHFERPFYCDEEIVLSTKNRADLKINLHIDAHSDFIDFYSCKKTIVTEIGENKFPICFSDDIKTGFIAFGISIEYKTFKREITLATEIKHKKQSSEIDSLYDTNTIAGRKEASYHFAVLDADPSSFKLISILNHNDSKYKKEFDSIIDKEVNRISNCEDCSDFYLVALYYVVTKYRDHEFVDEAVINKIENLFVNFRYGFDEPGNDVMWWFSENHALLFFVLKYLTAIHMPKATFTRSNEMGEDRIDSSRENILSWLKDFNIAGLTEWNSVSYIPIDFIGLCAIHEFGDEEMKLLSKKSIDIIFDSIAEYSFNGSLKGSTQGRAYEKILCSTTTDAISGLNWVYANEGSKSSFAKGVMLLYISDYTPTKYYYETINSTVSAKRKQGVHQEVYTEVEKTDNYLISSVIDYNPGEKGYQEHLAGIMLGDCINMWVNHPGEEKVIGMNRPSFWGGNGINPIIKREKGLIRWEFDLSLDLLQVFPKYTHCYFPVAFFDEYEIFENCAFAKIGNSYVVVRCSQEFSLIDIGASANCELRAYGQKAIWEMEITDDIDRMKELINEKL